MFIPDEDFARSLAFRSLPDCESEPVEAPGSIQSHGMLIVLAEASLRAEQVSANSELFLGLAPDRLLGRSASEIFGRSLAATIESLLLSLSDRTPIAFETVVSTQSGEQPFFLSLHRLDENVIVELEPMGTAESAESAETAGSAESDRTVSSAPSEEKLQRLRQLREINDRIGKTGDIVAFANVAVQEMFELTGYERVLFYRFDDDGTGAVIAERHVAGIESTLGFRYPAYDTPLRVRNMLRFASSRHLVDALASEVPLVRQSSTPEASFDMTRCRLRSVSPRHREFLTAMGVRSSLSISVVSQNKLWGVITCLHRTPRMAPPAVRVIGDQLSSSMSRHLESLQGAARERGAKDAEQFSRDLFDSMARSAEDAAKGIGSIVQQQSGKMRELAAAGGVAFVYAGDVWQEGATPTVAEIADVLEWLDSRADGPHHCTYRLIEEWPTFAARRDVACGLLARRIEAGNEQAWLLFFRGEEPGSIAWGRNLQHDFIGEGESLQIAPDRRFEEWTQPHYGRCRPWSHAQQRFAELAQREIEQLVVRKLAASQAGAEAELVALRKAFHQSSEAMVVVDDQYRSILANKSFEDLFGSIVAGGREGLSSLFASPDDFARFVEQEEGSPTASPSSPGRSIFDVRSAAGDLIPVVLRQEPICDESGESIGKLVLIADQSQSRLDDEERSQWERNLFETQRLESLGILASGIAHDFNNMLVAVVGNASLLISEPTASDSPEMLADILTAAEAAAELAHQMLDYAGQGSREWAEFSLTDIIADMAHLARSSVPSKIDINVNTAAESRLTVRADRSQMRQLFMNLILNSVEAVAEKRGQVSITSRVVNLPAMLDSEEGQQPLVGQLGEGQYCRVEIADNGCGIDEETLRHIFDPFFTTKSSGRGLGLAAVQGIVRIHRGALFVSSQIGVGTKAVVYLPYHTAEENAETTKSTDVPTSGGVAIVVDRDPYSSRTTRRILEQNGFTTEIVNDPDEAMDDRPDRPDPPSVMVVDCPTIDTVARQFLRQLGKRYPRCGVLIVSGFGRPKILGEAEFRQLEFLQKPYSAQELSRTIRSLPPREPVLS